MLDELAANRPLSFLAQFNCEELAKYDVEGLLPKHGLLLFFYEEETAEWGYDQKHKGCARVFYFEHINELKKAEFPEEEIEDAQQISGEKRHLLLQLDEVEGEDFYLSFGDCGRLYFYITKEDLQARKFENVWLVYQCF